jgi:hypothetical protein
MNVMLPKLKPVAPDTWEIRASLANADEESPRVSLEFPGPTTVVGAYCSVIQNSSNGGLLIPTLDDFLVMVDLDNQRRFTSGPTQGQSVAASRSSTYVTLATLDSRVRDLYLNCESARPIIGLTFRWKRFDAGVPHYEDAQISVALFVLPGTVTP